MTQHTIDTLMALLALREARIRLEWFVDSYPHDIAVSKATFFAGMDEAMAALSQPVQKQDAALLRKALDVLNGAEQMNSARPDKFEIELTAEQIDSLATEIRARLNGAQPVREPLTQNEIYELFRQHLYVSHVDQYSIHGAWEFARAIEKSHGIDCENRNG